MGEITMLLRAFISTIGLIAILTLLTYAGCAAIAEPISEYGQAVQTTEQTRIEWGAKVEIAKIEADASKKTSFNYVVFWLIRFFTWVLGLLTVGFAGLLGWQKFGEAGR